ncbi:MAG TPA: Si-specific NAD(P)(+) transhydrogenase [Blastocatellia bacterium]|jgi:NAD(P) transhydrogenase|nr:Si-specific NAD(P)(+) transhydrogenase [Blastocatellia bacterium]
MDNATYDLVVIGSGPAGQKGAIAAAKLGKKVAVIDRKGMIGGVSLHTGTIPSKTMREAILYMTGFRQRAFYGCDYALKERIGKEDLTARVRIVQERELEVVRHQFRRNEVIVIQGSARFLDPHTVSVTTESGAVSLTAEKVLVACGTRPARNSMIPFDGQTVIDSGEMEQLSHIPKELIVVGAGVIGIEYASMYAALDIRVTIIEQRPEMLDFVDREIVEQLQYHLRNLDVILRFGEKVLSVEKDPDGTVVAVLDSGKTVTGDALLYAVGRQTNADLLNLDAAGVAIDERGKISVNEHFQTAIPHIYAAGDVIGFPALAATSMEQGRLAASHMFGGISNYSAFPLPYGIYTIPEISMIGKTERQLTEEKIPYEVGVAKYDELARGQILGDQTGKLKLLFDPRNLKLLGLHIIGEGATELIHIGQTVLNTGATIEYFRDTVFNYPTLAEAYKVAALNGLNKLRN